ncbi:MAG: hypothetical protein ABIO70_01205 [Pseudomonadota bacterium]
MRRLLAALTLTVALMGASSPTLAEPVFGPHWLEHMQATGVLLVQPDDFDFVAPVQNPVMAYDLALRHSSGRVEARWAVVPTAEGEVIDPTVYVTAVLANVAAEVGAPLQVFPTADVGRDYNANWGGLTVIKPKAGFADEYQVAIVVALYREGKGMVYAFFLCKDLEADKPLMGSAFSALKFRDPQ